MKQILYPERKLEVRAEYDMLVCGSGLAGIAAAVNAAREGLKVGMIEYFGKPGGVPVSGLLGVVSGYGCGDERISSAFMNLLRKRAAAIDGVNDRSGYLMFDPEKLNRILLEVLEENHIEVNFYTQLIDAVRHDKIIRYAVTASKAGVKALKAGIFVDATGDGDLAVMAGCKSEIGREADGKVQSSSLTFQVSGIRAADVPKGMPEMTAVWRRHSHRVPTDHMVIKYMPERNGLLDGIVNMTHILDCNFLNPDDQVRIRREGTRQAFEILEFLQQHIPGYEHAYISATAEQLGVRETRRITGDYVLTEEDVLAGRDFPDEVARCCWGIDVHNPTSTHTGIEIPIRRTYGVPYRCITPLGVGNLYIAGRPISATHRAFSSSRINSTCIGLGEAIGFAAPMALREMDVRKVNVKTVQEKLERSGTTVHRAPEADVAAGIPRASCRSSL